MANRKVANEVREKIQASRIIRRLEAFVFNEPIKENNEEPAVPKMSAQQVKAALALVNKTVPDLKAIEVALDEETGKALIAAQPVGTIEEWAKSFGNPNRDHKPH